MALPPVWMLRQRWEPAVSHGLAQAWRERRWPSPRTAVQRACRRSSSDRVWGTTARDTPHRGRATTPRTAEGERAARRVRERTGPWANRVALEVHDGYRNDAPAGELVPAPPRVSHSRGVPKVADGLLAERGEGRR